MISQASPDGVPISRIDQHLPALYFAESAQAFAEAVALADNEAQFFFEIAGVRIRLRFAGRDLLQKITRTLAHLQIPETTAFDFTICCWDDKAAGVTMPRLPDWLAAKDARHCLRVVTNERYHAFLVEGVRILSCMDMETSTGYSCCFDASRLSMYEVSGPLRPILNAVLNRRGMQIVHAAAVGTPDGSLIFAGPPFSGKSTLAIRCLLGGLSYQSDDLCVVSAEPQPRSFSLYNIAKLREDRIASFASLTPVLSTFEEDFEKKAYFYVHEQFPKMILTAARIRAIVLTHVGDEPVSRIQKGSRRAAIAGVVNCTGKEIPMTGIAGEGIMFKAINRLPIWHLILGRDEENVQALVHQLLAC